MQLEGREEEVKGLMRQSPAGNERKCPQKPWYILFFTVPKRARAYINQGEQEIEVGN